jgi:Fe-S oxidoreductase
MRLQAHTQALYELRFSPMCKPATEVANLTQLESHTVRARTMMFWRIASGVIEWGQREVALTYESTLDSISSAFDVFHYPIHQYMLDARADIWDLDKAPRQAINAVQGSEYFAPSQPPSGERILLAGEIAQSEDGRYLPSIEAALDKAGLQAPAWVTPSGALAYALGAQETARTQAQQVIAGLEESGARVVIADGAETAWALEKIYPELGLQLPGDTEVKLLSEALAEGIEPEAKDLGPVFVHDSRAAYLVCGHEPDTTVILPGYTSDESTFGQGPVYDAPRALVDACGGKRVWGSWTRALSKSCGADDGLWLTHPKLAAGLAGQRLDYAISLGAATLVTESPLAAAFLAQNVGERDIAVKLLTELI